MPAGLINLLDCRQAFVVEIFASGHGGRADCFQIACINDQELS
jgi:hypothetical protein